MKIIKNSFGRWDIDGITDNYQKKGKNIPGIASYSQFWGIIAFCFGWAIKCKDEYNQPCYLIKSSSLKYLSRHKKELDKYSKASVVKAALESLTEQTSSFSTKSSKSSSKEEKKPSAQTIPTPDNLIAAAPLVNLMPASNKKDVTAPPPNPVTKKEQQEPSSSAVTTSANQSAPSSKVVKKTHYPLTKQNAKKLAECMPLILQAIQHKIENGMESFAIELASLSIPKNTLDNWHLRQAILHELKNTYFPNQWYVDLIPNYDFNNYTLHFDNVQVAMKNMEENLPQILKLINNAIEKEKLKLDSGQSIEIFLPMLDLTLDTSISPRIITPALKAMIKALNNEMHKVNRRYNINLNERTSSNSIIFTDLTNIVLD